MSTKQIDIQTNLLPFVKEKKYHRALFVGGIFKRTERESFTILDFWKHFIIATIGSREASGRMGSFSKQERLDLIENIIAEQRPIRTSEINFIYKIVEKYGLQTILFAIDDIYTDEEYSGLPKLELILNFTKSGSVYLHKLLREDKNL